MCSRWNWWLHDLVKVGYTAELSQSKSKPYSTLVRQLWQPIAETQTFSQSTTTVAMHPLTSAVACVFQTLPLFHYPTGVVRLPFGWYKRLNYSPRTRLPFCCSIQYQRRPHASYLFVRFPENYTSFSSSLSITTSVLFPWLPLLPTPWKSWDTTATTLNSPCASEK